MTIEVGTSDRRPRPIPHIGLTEALDTSRFEVIPSHKIAECVDGLTTATRLAVTCSPTWGIERTLEVSERLAARGHDVVPHISARLVEGRDHLDRITDRLAAGGLRNVFVVGGDAPAPRGPFASAGALLEVLEETPNDIAAIGVPAYPDGHPLIAEADLRAALLAKQRWASYAVTQMCLDAGAIRTWLRGVRADGLALPVQLGVPGVIDRRKLLDIAVRIGVGPSTRFLKKNTSLITAMLRRREYRPNRLLDDVAPLFNEPTLGVAGLHLNTFNQVLATSEWRAATLARQDSRASRERMHGGAPAPCATPALEPRR